MRLTVEPERAGERLDALLAGPLGSRSVAQRALRDGAVTVDGKRAKKSHVVAAGEVVEVAQREREAPAAAKAAVGEEASFAVGFEDEHLLVVDKPAGVVVHPAPGHATGTLVQALVVRGAAGGGDPERPGLVHRLDRDTSGLLVVAKSDAVLRALQDALRERALRREYLALVDGRVPARTFTVDAPLGRDRRVRTRHSIDTDEPREAITHAAVEELLPGDRALLRVTLDTGRTHQIRAHLEAVGLPVCGDPEYGRPFAGLERQFLHAARLAFAHPVTGEDVDVESALPEELASALTAARAG